ncbi:MAG TPA: peptidase S1, partial [Ramlibacter sp.]|nr:peptidase S1 [Ramlibacter sp.]
MRRPALYSSSRRPAPAQASPAAPAGSDPAQAASGNAPVPRTRRFRFSASSPRVLWSAILVLALLLAFSLSLGLRGNQRKLTQDDINAAVLKTLETQVLPSEYARAYDNIRPSVVRVVSYVKRSRLKDEPRDKH